MTLAIIVENSEFLQKLEENTRDLLLEFRIDLDPALLDKVVEYKEEYELILTLRSDEEGGAFSGNREEILHKMIELQPTYIDLEYHTDLELVEIAIEHGITPVVSRHDYSETMSKCIADFIDETGSIQNNEEIIVKFVGKPVDTHDLLVSLKNAANYFPRRVILGVGLHGILSRTLRSDFNQEFVFGATNIGPIPEYQELRETETENSLNVGLLGRDLSHSLSPEIHNLLRQHCGISGYYHLFEVKDEDNVLETVDLLSKTSLSGINITFPYKEKILPLTEMSPDVSLVNAANTAIFTKNTIETYNTDISGFQTYFEEIEAEIDTELKNILIFGAGGASRAVITALLKKERSITIVNRTKQRFDEFPEKLKEKVTFMQISDIDPEEVYDVYINATSVGYHEQSPADIVPIPLKTKLVFDLNYLPQNTMIVRDAIDSGIRAVDGKGMLFHQAVDAFEHWTSRSINRKEVFQKFLRSF